MKSAGFWASPTDSDSAGLGWAQEFNFNPKALVMLMLVQGLIWSHLRCLGE